MEWIWIAALTIVGLAAIAWRLGYIFFRYMCLENHKAADSLDGGEGRARQPDVPVIKEKA